MVIFIYLIIQAKDEEIPQCFISYCWSNSHDAIAKGSRHVDGALGWQGGDPRAVKNFLESKGIHCWLDIERVGGTGLFHSIADGLREAKSMVVFVSDEVQHLLLKRTVLVLLSSDC